MIIGREFYVQAMRVDPQRDGIEFLKSGFSRATNEWKK